MKPSEISQSWIDHNERLLKAHKWLKEQVEGCVHLSRKKMKELDDEVERRFKL